MTTTAIEGAITLIDFPQVIHSQTNSHAYEILGRDVTRVCEYFAQQGVRCHAADITNQLWSRYTALEAHDTE
jgi:RIO-like serine/threonine protein kinase